MSKPPTREQVEARLATAQANDKVEMSLYDLRMLTEAYLRALDVIEEEEHSIRRLYTSLKMIELTRRFREGS